MRRLIGLLMILALILPPLLGIGAVVIAADGIARVQASVNTRVEAISDRLRQTETMIDAVSARFDALKTIADQVSAAARAASQEVAAADFTIRSAASPTSPSVALGTPGMSTARRFLQNLYDTLGSLSSAIADVTTINQIPGQFGLAVTEAQGLSADLNALSESYSPLLLFFGIAVVVWLALIYVVAVYRWAKPAWGLLTTGRAA